MIYPTDVRKFYPQDFVQGRNDNVWFCPVTIGLKDDVGKTFYIYAILTDKQAQSSLNMYINQAKDANDSPGIKDLPEGAQIYDYVKVIRK